MPESPVPSDLRKRAAVFGQSAVARASDLRKRDAVFGQSAGQRAVCAQDQADYR